MTGQSTEEVNALKNVHNQISNTHGKAKAVKLKKGEQENNYKLANPEIKFSIQ